MKYFSSIKVLRKELCFCGVTVNYRWGCFFLISCEWFAILNSDSHLPKKNFHLLQWQPFKNDEKCFLFYLKSSFRSQDIGIKGYQVMKFGQLIEYNKINIFLRKSRRNEAGRLVSELLLSFWKSFIWGKRKWSGA